MTAGSGPAQAQISRPLAVTRPPRIYVLPTRFGGAFVAVSLLTLVGCVNYLLSLGYALTFLLLSVWVVCAVRASRALGGMHVQLTPPDRAFAGTPLTLNITLTGPGAEAQSEAQPLGVRLGTALLWLEIPDDQASGPLVLPPLKRGPQRLPVLRLEGHDPLSLWRSSCYPEHGPAGARLPGQILIYPAPEVGAPPPPLARHAGHTTEARRAAGDEEVHGLREYRPGDAPRRIAWKQAARLGTLLSRTYDAPQTVALALDWQATAAAGEAEARLSRLCAWVLEAERCGSEFSLSLPGTQSLPGIQSLPGTRLDPGTGDLQVRRALELLAHHERPTLPPPPRRRWPGLNSGRA